MLILQLPFPPTVNTYWRHIHDSISHRTLISRKGRAYRDTVVGLTLEHRSGGTMKGPLQCAIDLFPPDARRRDCDNYAKAILDALETAKIYDNDSQIKDLHIRMLGIVKSGGAIVRLKPLDTT